MKKERMIIISSFLLFSNISFTKNNQIYISNPSSFRIEKVINFMDKEIRVNIPAMSSIKIKDFQEESKIEIQEKEGDYLVKFQDKIIKIGRKGIEEIKSNKKKLEFIPQDNFDWKIKNKNPHSIIFFGKTDKGKIELTVRDDFIIEIKPDFDLEIRLKDSPYLKTYHWGPSYGVRTYHLEEIPTPYEPGRGIQKNLVMKLPLEWSCILDTNEKIGIWVKGENVIVMENRFKISSRNKIFISFLEDENEGYGIFFKTEEIPIFIFDGKNFESINFPENEKIIVIDRNKNGFPDFKDDIWEFYKNGVKKCVYQFYPYEKDPFKEGNICYISFDLNGDGKLEEEEIEKPVYKLCDWNKDGIFLKGNIFLGGFIEQDCFYYRKSGSPYKTIWDYKHCAYDLDGDGDCDIWLSLENYNFIEGGITTYGTATSTTGFQIDYSDRPYSFTLIFSPFEGKEKQVWIGYDFYFFQDNSCSTTAYYQHKGIFTPTEEHMEYEGFNPFYGEGHLWAWNLSLERINMGELGGWGKWKVGIAPGVNHFYFPPSRRDNRHYLKPKLHIYSDPWGHKIKIKSFLMPDRWDGKRVVYKKRKESLDYVENNPWAIGVNLKTPSYAYIEDPEFFGEVAFEAYVGCDRSNKGRYEWAREGKTTGYFYYSPLINGLHHKGISFGYTADQTLFYFDRDNDGIVDTYVLDYDNDGYYEKRLWYFPNENKLIFWENGERVSWKENIEIEGVKFYLENFKLIDDLYRKSGKPVIENLTIKNKNLYFGEKRYLDERGKKPPLLGDERYIDKKPVIVAYDKVHSKEGETGWLSGKEEGMKGIVPFLSKSPKGLMMKEIDNFELSKIDVLIINDIFRMLSNSEINEIYKWVENGGKVIIYPAYQEEENLIPFNFLLKKIGVSIENKFLNCETKKRRIPDQGNIIGDIAEERFPTKLNRVENFQSEEKSLLKDIYYFAFKGFPLKIEDGEFKVLLSYLNNLLIVEKKIGKGRVIISGIDFLSNRWIKNPIHTNFHIQNVYFVENLFNYLLEEEEK